MYGRTDMECKQAKERYGLATAQGDVYILGFLYRKRVWANYPKYRSSFYNYKHCSYEFFYIIHEVLTWDILGGLVWIKLNELR